MSETTPLIQVKNVQQEYGSGDRRFIAVENVNLSIHEKEFVALLGPSGCGKSTLLRIITGLQPPSEGQVLYRGEPLKGVNPHATIVFQTFALFPWLNVQENVELALQVRGVPPAPHHPRPGSARPGGSGWVRDSLSARAFGRDAPEGRLCPRHGGRARAAVPGRAFLGAGCAQRRDACAAS